MNEIRQAKNAGIDGWTLDILNMYGTTWDTVVRMVDAADAVGEFKIILSLDMTPPSAAPTAAPSPTSSSRWPGARRSTASDPPTSCSAPSRPRPRRSTGGGR